MERKDLPRNLPDTPGVYLFKRKRSRGPLYIGKATSLRDRVRSYFNQETEKTRGPAIVKMLQAAEKVETIQTESVLEALLLESELIKKLKPRYNVREKDDKSFNYVVTTKEEFPKVLLIRGKELRVRDAGGFRKIFGPFPRAGELKEALKIIRKIFPWRDDRCNPNQGKPCFNRHIGLCPGVCTGEISKIEYLFLIRNLELLFAGKKDGVIKNLRKEMTALSRDREFEKASVLRDKIFALEHIRDVALLKKEPRHYGVGERIEGYDIAHLAGMEPVGVMVVMENGKLQKSEYRTFKIRSANPRDDVGNLRELLTRRFSHDEWRFPGLLVLDGGTGQISAGRAVLERLGLQIPIVAVTKDEKHKPRFLRGDSSLVARLRDEIILVNGEAHRFALSFHKKRRGRLYRSPHRAV